MRVCGCLYEVTNFVSFARSYLTESCLPDPGSARPLQNVRVMLCRCDRAGSSADPLAESRTDPAGRFELDCSPAPTTPVFLVASSLGSVPQARTASQPPDAHWYRSSPVLPGAFDERPRDIYVARAEIPPELGFSPVDLAEFLALMKKQVPDLEQITGTISAEGIVLMGSGKGGTASGRIVLEPDRSGDLAMIVRHVIQDFRLDLPGPAWLVGLLVSKEAIEASIRAGVQDLAGQINTRLKTAAIQVLTDLASCGDPDLASTLAGAATLTLERLRYPIVSPKGEASGGNLRAVTGDMCIGFPRTLHQTGYD